MKLLIMRHGEASLLVEHMQAGDAQRPLTKQGYKEVISMAKWAVDNNIKISRIFVSPYRRAQQTSSTFISTYSQENHSEVIDFYETLDFITPLDNVKDIRNFIDGHFIDDISETVVIISHMPLVGNLVAELTQQSPVDFATAGICEIEYDVNSMQGQLVRMISPNLD